MKDDLGAWKSWVGPIKREQLPICLRHTPGADRALEFHPEYWVRESRKVYILPKVIRPGGESLRSLKC